jgi:hypothetical protein
MPDQLTIVKSEPLSIVGMQPEGSAVGRFAEGAWQNLNPMNLVSAAAHPVDAIKSLLASHKEQYDKAKDAFSKYEQSGDLKDLSEAAGHLGAAAVPMFGPAAAKAGESIAQGDVAGGLGQAAGLVAVPAMRAGVRAGIENLPGSPAAGVIGRGLTATGKGLERVAAAPLTKAVARAGGAGLGFHGQIGEGIATAVVPEAVEMAGRGLQRAGKAITPEAVRVPKPGAISPAELAPFNEGKIPAPGIETTRALGRWWAAKNPSAAADASPVETPPATPALPSEPVARTPAPAPTAAPQPSDLVTPEEAQAVERLVKEGYAREDVLRELRKQRETNPPEPTPQSSVPQSPSELKEYMGSLACRACPVSLAGRSRI